MPIFQVTYRVSGFYSEPFLADTEEEAVERAENALTLGTPICDADDLYWEVVGAAPAPVRASR